MTADPRGAVPATPTTPTPPVDDAAPHDPVDWDRAARWAGRLAPPGPQVSRAEAEALVEDLHAAVERARPVALRASRLAPLAADAPAPQVLVVDRPGWAVTAARSVAGLVGPIPDGPGTAETAALLAALAGRVVGQFDPFGADVPPGGRLVLVAPNVLQVRRALSADARDLHLWVAVHEQTHALQFGAAPWLAGHLRREVAALVADLAAQGTTRALVDGVRSAIARRGDGDADDDLGVLGLALTPDQRRRVDDVGAVMALLEGHAEVSMDAVGARTIPSVRRLRARLDARRSRVTGVDRVLHRVLGMEAKLAQYRQGAAFVRAVRRTGGRTALDAVWAGPEHLPTPREIADPSAWVRRVHG